MSDGHGLRSGIDRDRWPRIRALFHEALELPADQRSQFLDRACGDHRGLREEVETLLRADEATGTALDRPIAALAAVLLSQPEDPGHDPLRDGARIGAWQIVREVARGGMGAVYVAERADGQFEQRVALKVVKRGLDTDEIQARFRLERQILARLQHPGIAHLVDGGVTSDGRPWFAMDFVEGEPLTEYCRSRIREVRELLGLFVQACRAVEYAHRNLVVHRDLKPGNILVTPEGAVKLLDFGIAKLLEPQPQGLDTVTFGPRMTPHYAAPEQVRGEPPTTATDVYALGVILYELFAGERPYRLTTMTLAELESAILEQEPMPPSTRAGRPPVDGPLSEPALARSAEWRREVRGDLDNIVLKALRKEPELRYPTATALREDLVRSLAGRPVLATPPSLVDRTVKFVRRHRAGVLAGFLVLTSLVAGLVGVSWQAQRAREEARKSDEIRDFLVGLFEASDPAKGDTLTAIELLERGTDRIERELAGQPTLQAEMLRTLAGIYRQLQAYDRAESLARAYVDDQLVARPGDRLTP